jgi:hypothetical protein
MLTPLSVLSLDQGPKWRAPDETSAVEEPKVPEVAPGRRLKILRAVEAWLAMFAPVLSRSRA